MTANLPLEPGQRIRVTATSDRAIPLGSTGMIDAAGTVQGRPMVTLVWDAPRLAEADPALVEAFGDRWEVAA
jgi:hypothetical protein